MKNVILKYVSAFLAMWYLLSITGFDVHSCSSTGNTFVSPVLTGTTCEDIHPDHDCTCHSISHSCSCCHSDKNAAAENIDKDHDCCTDEIEVLDGEVIVMSDDGGSIMAASSDLCLYVENYLDHLLHCKRNQVSYNPDSGSLKEPDLQAVLNVWRI